MASCVLSKPCPVGGIKPLQTRKHCFPNVSLFAHTENICCRNNFCIQATKNVSELFQKHFVASKKIWGNIVAETSKYAMLLQCFVVC